MFLYLTVIKFDLIEKKRRINLYNNMIEKITFVSGNKNKAAQIEKYLRFPVDYANVTITEIQSLDPAEVATHKAVEIYRQLKRPLITDDSAFSFLVRADRLPRLPGTFIDQFLDELGPEGLCRLVDSYSDRSAVASAAVALHTGTEVVVFEASVRGKIADKPRGDNGYGWDSIFIPEGHERTRGEMKEGDEERDNTSVRKKVLGKAEIYLFNQR